MATVELPRDFKEFLKLLNAHRVEYLLVGGYAVAWHGYARATADMDLWVSPTPENAGRLVRALREFGFSPPELKPDIFLEKGKVIRMGRPPVRIEILTDLSGVRFDECYDERQAATLDGVRVNLISLARLKANKKAAGRHKDLDDLENLP